MAEEFLSFDDTLKELQLNEEELKKMVSEGDLRAFRQDDQIGFRKEDIESFRKLLTGLDIYKLLPKTNCGKCGVPTCLAFAMALKGKKTSLDKCPDVSAQAKAALDNASAIESFRKGQFYTWDVVLDELKLTEDELNRMVSEGKIRAFRSEDEIVFKREDIENLKKERFASIKKCSKCGQVYNDTAEICNCGQQLSLTVTPERFDEEEPQQEHPVYRESIFKRILIGAGGFGLVYGSCLFSILQYLYIALAGLSMIALAIKLFSAGSIIWGLVALLIGTPIAMMIAGFFFIFIFILTIIALIIWGASFIFGFNIPFSSAWDIVWFGGKSLLLGGLAFLGITGLISAIRENKMLGFFKEYWWVILAFCFLFWSFFINSQDKSPATTIDEKTQQNITGFFEGYKCFNDASTLASQLNISKDIPGDIEEVKSLLKKSKEEFTECDLQQLNSIYSGWGDVVSDKFIPAIDLTLTIHEKEGDRVNAIRADALIIDINSWIDKNRGELLLRLNEKYGYEIK